MNRIEFEQMRREQEQLTAAKVEVLTREFNVAKDRLITAKQELKYWQELNFDSYCLRN
jgi:hypothetical protein